MSQHQVQPTNNDNNNDSNISIWRNGAGIQENSDTIMGDWNDLFPQQYPSPTTNTLMDIVDTINRELHLVNLHLPNGINPTDSTTLLPQTAQGYQCCLLLQQILGFLQEVYQLKPNKISERQQLFSVFPKRLKLEIKQNQHTAQIVRMFEDTNHSVTHSEIDAGVVPFDVQMTVYFSDDSYTTTIFHDSGRLNLNDSQIHLTIHPLR